jgi:hypothetical protein
LQDEQTTNTIYIALALLGCWRTRAYTASARAECIVDEQFDWPTQEKCQVLAVLHSLSLLHAAGNTAISNLR